MKTVGKQLKEARLAKNWTPELAARETKIKVDRLRDLEGDDYSHFTSPTYARGFVRTYARSLGLDEYKILRQLDNKLPDDDSANIVTDTGIAYLPETAMPPRVAHRDYTGLYIVTALGALVTLVIAFVLFEAYRVGELSRYFGTSPDNVAASTNAPAGTNVTDMPASSSPGATARALPLNSDTPPPVVETAAPTPTPTDAAPSVRAEPVDASVVAAIPVAAVVSPVSTDAPVKSVRALPVDPSELATTAPPAPPVETPAEIPVAIPVTPDGTPMPPRALPVNPGDLAAVSAEGPETQSDLPPPPAPSLSARQSNSGPSTDSPVIKPALPVVQPPPDAAPAGATATPATDKRLVLTASQDSFVRVTDLEAPQTAKPLYAAVLHTGQSVGFDGRKFSINVTVPSAVNIQLDGVNYGPHSDHAEPETFNVESHLP
jgi:cytoskeleton protein RodZ